VRTRVLRDLNLRSVIREKAGLPSRQKKGEREWTVGCVWLSWGERGVGGEAGCVILGAGQRRRGLVGGGKKAWGGALVRYDSLGGPQAPLTNRLSARKSAIGPAEVMESPEQGTINREKWAYPLSRGDRTKQRTGSEKELRSLNAELIIGAKKFGGGSDQSETVAGHER